jgi:hypothetical protein
MANIAVLTKNYRVHLDRAVRSGGPVTFYSNVRWASASAALTAQKPVAIYFVADGGTGVVEYQATIAAILLAPLSGTAAVNKLLSQAPDAAAKTELESGAVKTLYSIVGLKKLPQSFSQTKLLKLSDGKPVSKDYDRSYCLVSPLQ